MRYSHKISCFAELRALSQYRELLEKQFPGTRSDFRKCARRTRSSQEELRSTVTTSPNALIKLTFVACPAELLHRGSSAGERFCRIEPAMGHETSSPTSFVTGHNEDVSLPKTLTFSSLLYFSPRPVLRDRPRSESLGDALPSGPA